MREITKKMLEAWNEQKPTNLGNTSIRWERGELRLYLFDNLIAKQKGDILKISCAGWQTATTKERLNALPGVSIQQKAGIFYLNGEKMPKNKFITI